MIVTKATIKEIIPTATTNKPSEYECLIRAIGDLKSIIEFQQHCMGKQKEKNEYGKN
jgi:hypothetical protein